jgi:hypothetical protein
MLSYPYRRVPRRTPSFAGGGQMFQPRSFVAVTVVGPLNTRALDCLIDTGADDVVFPEFLAAVVGIDLSSAPTQSIDLADRSQVAVRFTRVTLRIAAQNERREWQTWVGFSPALPQYGLLGFAGFSEYFTTVLHGDLERVDLTVNPTYPGT